MAKAERYSQLVTVRLSVRIAGLAILAAELMASASGLRKPSGLLALTILIAVQLTALIWSTSPRSAAALRVVAPAVLTGVTSAGGWTALAFADPRLASNDALAIVAIAAAGAVVAIWPPRATARRVRPVMMASATTALLVFLMISSVLPASAGFVANSAPPTQGDVTRLVDPVLEFAVFAVLAFAVLTGAARDRVRRRRVAGSARADASYGNGANEMVVLPIDSA